MAPDQESPTARAIVDPYTIILLFGGLARHRGDHRSGVDSWDPARTTDLHYGLLAKRVVGAHLSVHGMLEQGLLHYAIQGEVPADSFTQHTLFSATYTAASAGLGWAYPATILEKTWQIGAYAEATFIYQKGEAATAVNRVIADSALVYSISRITNPTPSLHVRLGLEAFGPLTQNVQGLLRLGYGVSNTRVHVMRVAWDNPTPYETGNTQAYTRLRGLYASLGLGIRLPFLTQ